MACGAGHSFRILLAKMGFETIDIHSTFAHAELKDVQIYMEYYPPAFVEDKNAVFMFQKSIYEYKQAAENNQLKMDP